MKYPSLILFPNTNIFPETDGRFSFALSAEEYMTVKAAINTLMAKRKYGSRPMQNYQVATSVVAEQKVIADHGNTLYSPYQRMISSDAAVTPGNLCKTGDTIERAPFDALVKHITKYSDFSIYHNNNDDTGCGGYCSGLCSGGCATGCKTSCKNSCGGNCASFCTGTCSVNCTGCTGCSGGCATSCTSCVGCGSGCTAACSQRCAEACEADCDSTCQTDCSWNCQDFCADWCEETCYDDCSGSCIDSCDGSCTSSCDTSCKNGCSMGGRSGSCSCQGECANNCSYKCMDNCSGTCNEGCKGGCYTGCTGYCDKDCRSDCSGLCKGYCLWGCQGSGMSAVCGSYCVQTCGISQPCEGTCSSTCFGICTDSCSNDCAGSCGYACHLGCSGQVIQYNWDAESMPYSRIAALSSSSQSFTVPNGTTSIYVFAVGGGGGSAGAYVYYYSSGSYEDWYEFTASGGGGGGYTRHEIFSVNPGDRITVDIGAGGNGGVRSQNRSATIGGDGTMTKVYINGTLRLVAAGGFCGGTYFSSGTRGWDPTRGGYGGSGGGQGITDNDKESPAHSTANNGGTNGYNGLAFQNSSVPAYGQRTYIPPSVSSITISGKTFSGSSGDSTTCVYNKTCYGNGGGGGGSYSYAGESEGRTWDGYWRYAGGRANYGGGHGSDGDGSNQTEGANGTGGGGGGARSGWSYSEGWGQNGKRGGDGIVIIGY